MSRVEHLAVNNHPALHRYLKIHKVWVGPKTADTLRGIHDELAQSDRPMYLFAAGSAAAEAGIVGTDYSSEFRHELLDAASETWDRGSQIQFQNSETKGSPEYVRGSDLCRWRMNQAFLPLYHDMIDQNVRRETLVDLHQSLLTTAAYNAGHFRDGRQAGDKDGAGIALGLGHELNTLLLISRLKSPVLVAVPATARADDGCFHRQQTHDINLMNMKWGSIRHSTPIEVKTRVRYIKIARYEAALVRGRIHLGFSPHQDPMLETFDRLLAEEVASTPDPGLDHLTKTIIHLIRHHRVSDGLAKRCLDAAKCDTLPRSQPFPISA